MIELMELIKEHPECINNVQKVREYFDGLLLSESEKEYADCLIAVTESDYFAEISSEESDESNHYHDYSVIIAQHSGLDEAMVEKAFREWNHVLSSISNTDDKEQYVDLVDNPNTIIYDSFNEPILMVNEDNRAFYIKTLEDSYNDVFDIVEYHQYIDQAIANCKNEIKDNFDYYMIGKWGGYKAGQIHSRSLKRQEVFKAQKKIEEYSEYSLFPELVNDDIKYYKGYSAAISDLIHQQDRIAATQKVHWKIHIINLYEKELRKSERYGELDGYGSYELRCINGLDIVLEDNPCSVYCFCIPKGKKKDYKRTKEQINTLLKENKVKKSYITFDRAKKHLLRRDDTETIVKRLIRLACQDENDISLLIDPQTIAYYDQFVNKSMIPNLYAFSPYDKDSTCITIRNTNKIFAGCFCNNNDIQHVVLPEKLEVIPERCFYHCESLEKILVPNLVEKIGPEAMAFCTSLTSFFFVDTIKEVGAGAFWGCKSLKTVKIPKNIKEIHDRVFAGCEGLETVKLPEKLQVIGDNAFSGCISLKSLSLPKELNSIGREAFKDCSNLERIDYNGPKHQWREIEKGDNWYPDSLLYVNCTNGEIWI